MLLFLSSLFPAFAGICFSLTRVSNSTFFTNFYLAGSLLVSAYLFGYGGLVFSLQYIVVGTLLAFCLYMPNYIYKKAIDNIEPYIVASIINVQLVFGVILNYLFFSEVISLNGFILIAIIFYLLIRLVLSHKKINKNLSLKLYFIFPVLCALLNTIRVVYIAFIDSKGFDEISFLNIINHAFLMIFVFNLLISMRNYKMLVVDGMAIIGGFCGVLSWILYFKCLEYYDNNIVFTFYSMFPAYILILSCIFLKTKIYLEQVIYFILLMACLILFKYGV